MTFAQLWATAPARIITRPLRPDFHSLLLITSGVMTHTVDFNVHRLGPGGVLWVRPGQVQQFSDDRPAGDLVLFEADFLLPGTQAAAIADDRFGLISAIGSAVTRGSVDRFRRVLRREYTNIARGHPPTAAQTETLRHLLSALILSLETPDRKRTDPAGLDRSVSRSPRTRFRDRPQRRPLRAAARLLPADAQPRYPGRRRRISQTDDQPPDRA